MLDDGPALICNQQDGLDTVVVLVVQALRNVFLQIHLHAGVALFQQSVNGFWVWSGSQKDFSQHQP